MIRLRALTALVICLLPALLEGQPASGQKPSAKIWLGRYEEIEDYLRAAECERMEVLNPSMTRCTLRAGGPVARMAWRPLPPGVHRGFRESSKTEIAGYELDKLLKMDMVPPTVERQLDGITGSAQLWVENVTDSRTDASPAEQNRAGWENQLVRMTMFDNLIGNRERNRATMLRDAGWNLILIDHSRAFGTDTELRHKMSRADEGLWARIESLTRKQLDTVLGPWLDDDQIAALVERREKMKAEVKLLLR